MLDKYNVEKCKLIDVVYKVFVSDDLVLVDFVSVFYDWGVVEDIVGYFVEELIGFVCDVWQDFQNYDFGIYWVSIIDFKFRVKGDKVKNLMVVEVVNDNMLFLVDLVMDELQDSKLEVYLVLYLIFIVEWDDDGKLIFVIVWKKLLKCKDWQESVIYIYVICFDNLIYCEVLQVYFDKVLINVCVVVNDFKLMQECLGEVIDIYKIIEIFGSSDELWEVIYFLEWMENDNFIFFGM